MPYSITEHKHRFSAWAASRAASVKGCRFSVEQGKVILEQSGLRELIEFPLALPAPEHVDDTHRSWRNKVINTANGAGLNFTHGVAAKLINIYLKAAFVCGGHHDHPRVCALHPPIDSVLLDGLIAKNVGNLRSQWRRYATIRWSNFDSQM